MKFETRLDIYDEILVGLKKTEYFNINDVVGAIPEERSVLFADTKEVVEFVLQFLNTGNTTLYMEYEGLEMKIDHVLDLLMNEKEFVHPQTGEPDPKWGEKTFMYYSLNDSYIERREMLLKERGIAYCDYCEENTKIKFVDKDNNRFCKKCYDNLELDK